jgi:uncharacterized DUF497 family protein
VDFDTVVWDMDDDPEGNVRNIAEHSDTQEEVEEVLANATDADTSASTGRPAVFGDTSTGKHLIVVFKEIDEHTCYPITAYEVPPRGTP